MTPDAQHPVLATAISMALDALAADVVAALERADVDAILLRGPALATWLYDDASRTYGDIDLLVPSVAVERAESVLVALGFDAADRSAVHAAAWIRRADGATLDLHTSLVGVRSPDAWDVLAARRERLRVGGADVPVLEPAARALLVALHAAQHGAGSPKPLKDLERALDRVAATTWGEAAALAVRLDAMPAFATGLRLLPGGREVAARLGLPHVATVEGALRAATPPPTALGLQRLVTRLGLAAKARLIARELVPSKAFMRAWSPWPVRPRGIGLAVAYALRPLWLVWHLGPALNAWGRAWRTARAAEPGRGEARTGGALRSRRARRRERTR